MANQADTEVDAKSADAYWGEDSVIDRGAKPIGPSFYDELVAHGGLVGEHFTWSEGGVLEFFEDTPPAVVDGVRAVYAAHKRT